MTGQSVSRSMLFVKAIFLLEFSAGLKFPNAENVELNVHRDECTEICKKIAPKIPCSDARYDS